MKALPIISGRASTVTGPLLVSDAAKALQKRIDEQGLTGMIEEQSGMIGDEAGASLFMEDVIKEKRQKRCRKAWTMPARWNSEFNQMRNLDEIVKDIKTVLEEKVAPSVAAHNGSIGFIDFAPELAWLL